VCERLSCAKGYCALQVMWKDTEYVKGCRVEKIHKLVMKIRVMS